ncbi:programmed cell death protein 5 [Diorhabda carinulata]|uniref:programmed cell death protein 5 n=1 Tax=Diorhabda sublineata TaxID=1163346 RepID=UPI0024E10B8B|nr:programmed cell death protein 5 [Diorhabda sublineata]XP_057653365.1 programmed cell death protein 5 [Diorhabda carinulata]
MSDSDLETIRKQILAQYQSQHNDGDSKNQQAKEEQLKAQEDMKNGILAQILDQSARARLNTIMLSKPERGKMVENMLVQMARTGQICTKIGEKDLIGLLENVNNQTKSTTSVKFDRRRAALDSDDEDF